MSDFWGGLSNFRFPDARIDADRNAPLPTTLSGPAGINGEADGKYNFNGELLSGITNYAGPKTGRISSDRNYQQIPHRKQVFVPQVYLPTVLGNDQIRISHAVDNGDLAFVINPRQRPETLLLQRQFMHDRALVKKSANIPTLVNLATVNYMLAGLQTYLMKKVANPANYSQEDDMMKHQNLWCFLANDIWGKKRVEDCVAENDIPPMVMDFFKWCIVPFGICAGSEKQGGQHEVGLAPVQAAASHMTTLTVDGRNQDLVNLWYNNRVFAGDELCLHLRYVEAPAHYTLNHYYKETQSQQGFLNQVKEILGDGRLWQIAPSTQRTMFAEAMYIHRTPAPTPTLNLSSAHMLYWRIARTFVEKPSLTRRADDRFGELSTDGRVALRSFTDEVICDDAKLMRAHILEVNFAPVLVDHERPNSFTEKDTTVTGQPGELKQLTKECSVYMDELSKIMTSIENPTHITMTFENLEKAGEKMIRLISPLLKSIIVLLQAVLKPISSEQDKSEKDDACDKLEEVCQSLNTGTLFKIPTIESSKSEGLEETLLVLQMPESLKMYELFMQVGALKEQEELNESNQQLKDAEREKTLNEQMTKTGNIVNSLKTQITQKLEQYRAAAASSGTSAGSSSTGSGSGVDGPLIFVDYANDYAMASRFRPLSEVGGQPGPQAVASVPGAENESGPGLGPGLGTALVPELVPEVVSAPVPVPVPEVVSAPVPAPASLAADAVSVPTTVACADAGSEGGGSSSGAGPAKGPKRAKLTKKPDA